MSEEKTTKDKVNAAGRGDDLGQTTANGRVLQGTVVGTKMQDTITVAVERYVKHPKYKKYMRRTKKYLVHDAGNTATEGQKVTIRETNPISKRKHFELVKG